MRAGKRVCARGTAVLVGLMLTVLPLYAQNGSTVNDVKNTVISEGLQLVYSAQYDDAINYFRKLNEIDPESAEGIFFEAFVLELVMDVYRSQAFDDSLTVVVDKAIEKAKKAVQSNPTARNYMFLGGSYGIRGIRKGILGSWWGAAKDGMKANSNLQKSVNLDPEIFDNYYGIGTYHYWKTKKLRRFFGFFIPDRREQGIGEIKSAIERGIFAKTPGRMALFRIYIEEKRYDDVISLAEVVLEENPRHLFPRWYYGLALVRTEQWEKAKENYQRILNYLPGIEFRGIESMIEVWYYLGLCNLKLGDAERAREYLEKIPPYENRVNKNLFYYDDYIKQSKKLLRSLR